MSKVVIYASGEENLGRPEVVLGDKSNIMLSYHKYNATGRPDKRFRQILKSRKKRHGKGQSNRAAPRSGRG